MGTNVVQYDSALAEQLRINGVRERRVREIVAQVHDHCRVTGEDPVEAFGQPLDYARAWRRFHWTTWVLRIGAICLGLAGLVAVMTSVIAADVGWSEPLDVDGGTALMACGWAVAAVVSASLGLWFARRRARSLGQDRATWRVRTVTGAVWCLVAALFVGLFLWASEVWLPSGTLFTQPRWLVLVLGLLTLPGLRFWEPPSRNLPAPPNDTVRARLRRFWT
jgi:hypothetical protein